MSENLEKALKNIISQMETIEKKFDEKHKLVAEHPSQNGGWKRLESALERIEAQVTAIDISLNDQIAWRNRVDPILDANRKQDERILKLEMQLALYNKLTWALGLGTIGLIAKALMGLIITP